MKLPFDRIRGRLPPVHPSLCLNVQKRGSRKCWKYTVLTILRYFYYFNFLKIFFGY